MEREEIEIQKNACKIIELFYVKNDQKNMLPQKRKHRGSRIDLIYFISPAFNLSHCSFNFIRSEKSSYVFF